MRPRTRLTTPGGQEPETIVVRGGAGSRELYSHGFTLPVEPRLPARWPWVAVTVVAALLIGTLVYLLSLVTGVEEQDPSLGDVPSEAAVADR